MKKILVALTLFLSSLSFSAFAEEEIGAKLIAEHQAITPQDKFFLIVAFSIDSEYTLHITNEEGKDAFPQLLWTLPENVAVEKVRWSPYQDGAYKEKAYALIELKPKKELQLDEELLVGLEVRTKVCGKNCVPFQDAFETKLLVKENSQKNEEVAPLFEMMKKEDVVSRKGKESLMSHLLDFPVLSLLFLSFIGGLLLNVMPCVLPVISLKIFHLVTLVGKKRRVLIQHSLSFAGGILVTFWMLAVVASVLQTVGNKVGWGFHLQEPLFIASLILVLYIVALHLFGVFEFGTKVASIAGGLDSVINEQSKIHKMMPSKSASFFSGVLSTFIATPCTGPLLGSALGFTATFDPLISFLVFTSLGIGMAFPYILIGFFPKTLQFLPKPGPWMATFKQFMGFLLIATLFWLLWVLEAQVKQVSLYVVMLSLFCTTIAFWVYGTWGRFDRKSLVRAFSKLTMVIILFFSGYMLFQEIQSAKARHPVYNTSKKEAKGSVWEPFSEERIRELREKKQPFFINFHAKWCMLCQANKLVIESQAVQDAFKKYGIVKIDADWTLGDEEITEMLHTLGRNGVPVYALYGRETDVEPLLLPEVITQDIVIEAIKKTMKKE